MAWVHLPLGHDSQRTYMYGQFEVFVIIYPIHTTAENAHRCALMRILEFAPFTLQPQCAAKRILCPSEAKRSEF